MPSSPEQLGIKAPEGGFKQGGWYESRQYWEGTLSDPGQIHPSSDQQGAGQDVSNEVLAQTSVAAGLEPNANRDYIDSLKGGGGAAPQYSSQVDSFLGNYQGQVLGAGGDSIRSQLAGGKEIPALINREQSFKDLRAEYGLAALEDELNKLNSQVRDEEAYFREQRFTEEGKPVPLNVIAGRVGEEERTAKNRIDFLTRQKQEIVDELNVKYAVVGQIMEFRNLDYQDAVNDYERTFNQNLQIYQLVASERDRRQQIASANLQTIMNSMASGNVNYGSLDASTKAQISKLEVQAGMPQGFTSQVRKYVSGSGSAGSKVIATSTNNGVTRIITQGLDGNFDMHELGAYQQDTSNLTSDQFMRVAQQKFGSLLNDNTNPYGHVAPDLYKDIRKEWVIQAGGTPDSFDQTFTQWIDPYNVESYEVNQDLQYSYGR